MINFEPIYVESKEFFSFFSFLNDEVDYCGPNAGSLTTEVLWDRPPSHPHCCAFDACPSLLALAILSNQWFQ